MRIVHVSGQALSVRLGWPMPRTVQRRCLMKPDQDRKSVVNVVVRIVNVAEEQGDGRSPVEINDVQPSVLKNAESLHGGRKVEQAHLLRYGDQEATVSVQRRQKGSGMPGWSVDR